MAGKMILIAMILVCGATAYVIHGAFKHSPDFKGLVTEQMKMEFVSYARLIKKIDQLPVTEINHIAYSVPIKGTWSFVIHDKTLMIQAPAIEPTPPSEVKSQIETEAKRSVENFALLWLEDKFHTKKDLQVQAQF